MKSQREDGAPDVPAEAPNLMEAYAKLQSHITEMWAQQAIRNRPVDGKPRWFKTGRRARRAARRGYGLEKPMRSRCQRSAYRRGVRKVRS